MAAEIGISASAIKQYENGGRALSIRKPRTLSEAQLRHLRELQNKG